jgi:hypothetical protein
LHATSGGGHSTPAEQIKDQDVRSIPELDWTLDAIAIDMCLLGKRGREEEMEKLALIAPPIVHGYGSCSQEPDRYSFRVSVLAETNQRSTQFLAGRAPPAWMDHSSNRAISHSSHRFQIQSASEVGLRFAAAREAAADGG